MHVPLLSHYSQQDSSKISRCKKKNQSSIMAMWNCEHLKWFSFCMNIKSFLNYRLCYSSSWDIFLPINSHVCNHMQCIMINHQTDKTQRRQRHIRKVKIIIFRLCEYNCYILIVCKDSFDIIFQCPIKKIINIGLFK